MKTLCIIGLPLLLLLLGMPPQLAEAETLYRDTPYSKFVAGGKKWTREEGQNTRAKYVGEVSNGAPNGQGTIYFPGGDSYTGEFKGSRYDGFGTYIYANGSRKSGEWREGQFVGKRSSLQLKRPDVMFDTSSLFGKENFVFQVPGSSHLEHCVIPRKLPGIDYRKSDRSMERRLCTYDLYPSQAPRKKRLSVGSCPKNYSTSTGIDFYALPDALSLDEFRKDVCHLRKSKKEKLRDRKGYPKKLAKFKWSGDCVSASSILAYYHLSQFLETGRVPPAVIRTIDREVHFDFSLIGRYINFDEQLLKRYWDRIAVFHVFNEIQDGFIPDHIRLDHTNGFGLIPEEFRVDRDNWKTTSLPDGHPLMSRFRYIRTKEAILTADGTQIVGILSENPRGEVKYPDGGGEYNEKNRFRNFMQRNPYYQNLTSSSLLSELLQSRDLDAIGQMVVGMEDFSGMLILDFLMDQADRIGNSHYVTRYYYPLAEGKIKEMSAKKFEKLQSKNVESLSIKDQSILDSAVPIKEMILRDNDCGLKENNKTRKLYAVLEVQYPGKAVPPAFPRAQWWRNVDLYASSTLRMKHLNPKVYQRLLQLHDALITAARSVDANELARAERAKNYFQDELLMSNFEYLLFQNNLESLTIGLQTNCLSGNLMLDLDAKNYLAGADSPPFTRDICTSFEPLYF